MLAGGRSSRMGTNKALLEINGETLLNRAVRLLEQAPAAKRCLSVAIIMGNAACLIVPSGPLAGIAAGLDVCKTENPDFAGRYAVYDQ